MSSLKPRRIVSGLCFPLFITFHHFSQLCSMTFSYLLIFHHTVTSSYFLSLTTIFHMLETFSAFFNTHCLTNSTIFGHNPNFLPLTIFHQFSSIFQPFFRQFFSIFSQFPSFPSLCTIFSTRSIIC